MECFGLSFCGFQEKNISLVGVISCFWLHGVHLRIGKIAPVFLVGKNPGLGAAGIIHEEHVFKFYPTGRAIYEKDVAAIRKRSSSAWMRNSRGLASHKSVIAPSDLAGGIARCHIL